MKKKIWFAAGAAVLVLACVLLAVYGARMRSGEEPEQSDADLRVVILDSGDYYHYDAGVENGILMAIERAKQEQGIDISMEIVDDGEDYSRGISMAETLAEDDNVDLVISFQNFDSIDAVAEIFEEAKKPLIVTMGCYDDVADSGYQYFITDFLSGKEIGARIGRYIAELGLDRIALCHSDTTFEKDELQGLQAELREQENVSVRNSITGPFNEEELAALLTQCDKLGIHAVVSNFYNQEDSAWLVGKLRTLRPDLTVVGDYALDSTDILAQYGDAMEGAVIVPIYPYQKGAKMDAFQKEYEQYAGETFSTAAIQYYDLFCMLASCCREGGVDADTLMKKMKSENGYEGVAGTLKFDENGRLQTDDCPVFVCKDGEFVFLEE